MNGLQAAMFRARITPKYVEPVKAELPAPVPVEKPPQTLLDVAILLHRIQRLERRVAELELPRPVSDVAPRTTKIERIISVVGQHFGYSPEELAGMRRYRQLIIPRHIAIYLACELTNRSLNEVGSMFGGRDHATVSFARNKIAGQRISDQNLNRKIMALVEEIAAE